MLHLTDSAVPLLLMLGAIGFVIYRLLAQRVVTLRDLVLPLAAGLYLAATHVDWANPAVALATVGGALVGIVAGVVSAPLVRVWRGTDGQVYQRGGGRYAAVLLGLLVLRVAVFALLMRGGHGLSAPALDASIALALGLYLGRTVSLIVRAAVLVGWRLDALAAPAAHSGLVP